jgi:hypothetical protein
MDLLQLIIRLIAFAASLYILLDFIVLCRVNTNKAMLSLFLTICIVIFLFIVFTRYDLYTCEVCHTRLTKNGI